MKTLPDKGGHHRLPLQIKGKKKKNEFLHHLVARAFLGPKADGLQVLHRDDNKDDNRPGNLYYGTPLDNGRDRVKNGGIEWCRGAKHHSAKVNADIAVEIFRLRGTAKQIEIARRFDVTVSLVSHIHHGWAWAHLTGVKNARSA